MNNKNTSDLLDEFKLSFSLAQSQKNIEPIKNLFKRQNLSYTDDEKEYLVNALTYSLENNYLDIVDYLLTSSDLKENPCIFKFENPLQIASKNGYLDIFEYFSDRFKQYYPKSELDIVYFGLIGEASEYGNLNIVKYILDHPKIKDHKNLTKFESQSLQWAFLKGHLEIVKFYYPVRTDKPFEENFFLNAVTGSHFDIVKYCIFELNISLSEHIKEALTMYNDSRTHQVQDFFKIRDLNCELEKELSSDTINKNNKKSKI